MPLFLSPQLSFASSAPGEDIWTYFTDFTVCPLKKWRHKRTIHHAYLQDSIINVTSLLPLSLSPDLKLYESRYHGMT
jgi:hypothetical protein